MKAAKARNMLVMFDVAVNHMGPIAKYSDYPAPLNKASNFHENCNINYFANPPQSQSVYETCRINPVNPDLNTEDAETIKYLYDHITNLVETYKPDGLRLDTVRHIRKDFWPGFMNAAKQVFSFGEVANSDTAYVADYQNYMPSVANYPLFTNVVQNSLLRRGSMWAMETQLQQNKLYKNPSVLGTFIDNQDQDRILYVRNDAAILRTSIVLALFADGIPTIWQGTEQAFAEKAEIRRPVWDTTVPYTSLPSMGIYQYLTVMNKFRRDFGGDEFISSVHRGLWTTDSLHVSFYYYYYYYYLF
jgi:alpha-amylase